MFIYILYPNLFPDVKVAFSGIICGVGLLGNLLVMFVVLVLREFRKSVTHWYVLQLAIADSLFLITLPFKMMEDINSYWIYPEWMCKGKETLLFLNYYTSVSFLMIMSIDRYIAVCHPFSDTLQRLRKPKSAIIITVITWVVALLICIPVMLYSFKVGIKPNCRCTYQFPKPVIDPMASCLSNNLTLAECEVVQVLALPKGPEQHCKSISLSFGGGGNIPDYNYGATEATNILPSDGVSDVMYNGTSDVTNNGTINGTSNGGDFNYSATEATGISSGGGDVMYNGTSNVTNETDGDQSYPDYNYDYNDTFTDGTPESCHYHTRAYGFKVFNIFNFVVMFILPLAVMGVCYGLIIFRLTSGPLKDKSDSRSGTNKSSKSEKDRRRVTIMCLCLVGCFFVCWLPFHAVHIAKIVGISGQTDTLCRVLPVVASLLAYSNSALNPYLYSFLGGNFAQRWKAATGNVKKSVTKVPTSNSGVGAVHFKKKRSDNSSSQVSNTAITRLNRKSKLNDSSMDGSNTASNI
ncbi:somatostatin receptor type 2-like [Ciona intestinalis]